MGCCVEECEKQGTMGIAYQCKDDAYKKLYREPANKAWDKCEDECDRNNRQGGSQRTSQKYGRCLRRQCQPKMREAEDKARPKYEGALRECCKKSDECTRGG